MKQLFNVFVPEEKACNYPQTLLVQLIHYIPANIYLLKVNNRNTRKRCEICSKFTPFSGVSIVDFEQVNVCWDKSFTYIPNRSGPKINPWGTRQIIPKLDVFMFCTCTNCFLFER